MLKSKKMKLLELAVLEEDINGVIEYLGKKAHFEMYSGIQQEGAVSNSYKELFDRLHTAAVYLGVDPVVESIQPMGNLFEQHLFLLFDIIIMLLQQRLNITHSEMAARHRNIE